MKKHVYLYLSNEKIFVIDTPPSDEAKKIKCCPPLALQQWCLLIAEHPVELHVLQNFLHPLRDTNQNLGVGTLLDNRSGFEFPQPLSEALLGFVFKKKKGRKNRGQTYFRL